MGITGWGGVTLTVELDLSQAVEDIGVGSLAGSSLWDVDQWDSGTWQAGATFTDISDWVLGLDTSAGFSYEMDSYQTGRLSLTLDNTDGRFSPDNPSSPYRIGDSTTIGMLRPIRVTASWQGFSWPLFYGRLEDWTERYQGTANATVEVTAVDVFADLAAVELFGGSPAGGGELFGARINRILDAGDWKGARSVDVGNVAMQATTLEGSLLSLLSDVADAEGGIVYGSPNGTVHAEGRNALIEKERSNTVQVRFSNDADDELSVAYESGSLRYEYDGSQTVNSASFAVEGGSEQRYVDQDSVNLYGLRSRSASGLLAVDDVDALVLAQRLVVLYRSPERRVESLTFTPMLQPSDARRDLAWSVLASQRLQLRSLVRFEHETNAGFTIGRYLFVRSIGHRVSSSSWTVEIGFSSATVWQRLFDSRWGVGVWGSSGWSW